MIRSGPARVKQSLHQLREHGRCRWLFISLLSLLLLYPHLEQSHVGRLLLIVLHSVTCVVAVWVSAPNPRRFHLSIAAATPMVLLSWVSFVWFGLITAIAFWIATTLFFLVTTVTMFAYVARDDDITSDKIFGGISVYLLLGLTWFAAYNLEEILLPGSFRGIMETGGPAPVSSELLYFSFVTLTTVGYGDIVPVTSYARSLAILEGISGVLYIATFVARLVAMYKPGDD